MARIWKAFGLKPWLEDSFKPPDGNTGDPDEAVAAGSMAHQTFEKVKDMIADDGDGARCPTPTTVGLQQAWERGSEGDDS